MAAYDIGEAFQIIEEEMIASMSRNLKRHLQTEKSEGLNYSMWQAEQLAALNNFRKDNKKKFSGYFSTINQQIEDVLKRAHASGELTQEAAILEAIREGVRNVTIMDGRVSHSILMELLTDEGAGTLVTGDTVRDRL